MRPDGVRRRLFHRGYSPFGNAKAAHFFVLMGKGLAATSATGALLNQAASPERRARLRKGRIVMEIRGAAGEVSEWGFVSAVKSEDPFADLTVDIEVRGPGGRRWLVPAYWAGGNEWRVRFLPPEKGEYRWRVSCRQDPSLDDCEGLFVAVESGGGGTSLVGRGGLRVSADRRHLVYEDGTPFFWLADTWWYGLSSRLRWPDEFQMLTADRKAKGFTVVQLVAGLFPEVSPFDPRGKNEAGFAWEENFRRINPAWFDMADLRIRWLVKEGLVPCVLGAWGYYLLMLGPEKMKQHWRYIVARWWAYPVVWAVCGEVALPFYLSRTRSADSEAQISGWTEIARYIRQIDPGHRLVTAHPASVARDEVTDDSVIDFDMLQTGHKGYESIPGTMRTLRREVARNPKMPVLVGEVNYEGIMHGTHDEIQRLVFWGCLLGGAAGHTYGANGLWQFNRPGDLFGPSVLGHTWGNTLWEQAYRFPGGRHLGVGRKILQRYGWPHLEEHPEWVSPAAGEEDWFNCYAAGVPGRLRLIYIFKPMASWTNRVKVLSLEAGEWRAVFIDPRTADEYPIGKISAGADRSWAVPLPPEMKDWLLVLEKA